jgi:hypothetical protein
VKQPQDDRFQTHIREPRWQQIVSVILVAGGIIVWLALAIFVH